MSTDSAPVLYIPHGGGPLPLMGHPAHRTLTDFLGSVSRLLPQPEAIVVISAHWEERRASITSGSNPRLIYDYYGFPPETYRIEYPAPGHPELAKGIADLLTAGGIEIALDPQRGFDHGVFVPLKLMYPQADIPCVQLSLLNNLDPLQHIKLGESLKELRRHKVLILGSGLSFHNLRALMKAGSLSDAADEAFDEWLQTTCCRPGLRPAERRQRLVDWQSAPYARFCHPREEHLLPLHVCYGIAAGAVAETLFSDRLMGCKVSAFCWR